MKQELFENDKAILLLCALLGNDAIQPLSTSEYAKVVNWLRDKKKEPFELLKCNNFNELSQATKIEEKRIKFLLGRGFQLGAMIDKWSQEGIFVVTRSSPLYPIRLKKHLKQSAPPVLYYVGDISCVNYGGVAIVGSRNIDEKAQYFTKIIAKKCATEKMYVISGGAKGVDQLSVISTLEQGGRAICIVSDELLKKSLIPNYQKAIFNKQLVLISPYMPTASFNVGNAMGRNKLIYALADYAVVVNSDYNKGGTWSGATEEMRRENAIPIFVRNDEQIPLGNKKLIEKGAIPIDLNNDQSIRSFFDKCIEEYKNKTDTSDLISMNNNILKKKSKRKKIEEETLSLFDNL